MYIHVHESMYKYKHVCTMFSSVRTNLPYPVQVVRIPDDKTQNIPSLCLRNTTMFIHVHQPVTKAD